MDSKFFELTTNSSDIQMNMDGNDTFTLCVKNMLIHDILRSNFSLEELESYLNKLGKLKGDPIDVFNVTKDFSITTNPREIRMYIYPSGKFYISMPRKDRWSVLKDKLSAQEIAGYLIERTRSMQAANFFNET